MLLRDKLAVALRPLLISLAADAARANGDLALTQVVARVARVRRRVQKDLQPVLLVVFQNMARVKLPQQRKKRHARQQHGQQMHEARPGNGGHPEPDRQQHQSRPKIRLLGDQQHRHADMHQ